MEVYSASSLKQLSAGRHVAPIGHIIFVFMMCSIQTVYVCIHDLFFVDCYLCIYDLFFADCYLCIYDLFFADCYILSLY